MSGTPPDVEAAAPDQGPPHTKNAEASERNSDSANTTAEPSYPVVTASHRDSRSWTAGKLTFTEFISWVKNPADRKECGNYLFGRLRGDRRTKATILSRSAVTLDYDHPPAGAWARAAALGVLAVVHETFSSSPDAPRFRVIVPLDREVTPDEYPRVAGAVAARIGTEGLDPKSYQPEQYMFRPAVPAERRAAWEPAIADDQPVASADDLLAEMPEPPTEAAAVGTSKRADPFGAPGLIGAFNRSFDMGEGIARFDLPYAPAGPGRWTYTEADSGRGGMVEVADGLYYSHHASDPAYGRAWSVFDLYRLHAYGYLDELAAPATPLHRLPSQEALLEDLESTELPEWEPVRTERDRWAAEGFEDVEETPERPEGETAAGWGAVPSAVVAERAQAYLDGRLAPIRPEVGWLAGLDADETPRALFYRGRTNGVAGESNGGKTFTAVEATKQELDAGNAVVYVDFEDTLDGILMRLIDIGTDPAALAERLGYVQPDGKFDDPAARARFRRVLDEYEPTLVVIDSTGEALAMDGLKPNEDDDVARWFGRLPRYVSRHRSRPAVVVLDHVTKADGGLWPIGSQRKRAAINGAQYMQDVKEPFSRTKDGSAVIRCAKDRHGNYHIGQTVGELFVTNSTGDTRLNLMWVEPTAAEPGADGKPKPSEHMRAVAAYLEKQNENPGARTTNQVMHNVTGKYESKRRALAQLQEDGHVSVDEGPNRRQVYTLLRPYPDPAADFSEVFE